MIAVSTMIRRAGGKSLKYLLAGLFAFALAAAQTAQAYYMWKGTSDSNFGNYKNWRPSGKIGDLYFASGNLAGNAKVDIYFDKSYVGAYNQKWYKDGDSQSWTYTNGSRLHGLFFQANPAGTPWCLHSKSGSVYTYDVSEGATGSSGLFRVGDGVESSLRVYAVNLKFKRFELAKSATSGRGILQMDDQSSPVTFTVGEKAILYNGEWAATNVAFSTVDKLEVHNATVDKAGGNWNIGGMLSLATGSNTVARFYHRGGTTVVNNYLQVGANSGSTSASVYFEISGGTVRNTAQDMAIGDHGPNGGNNYVVTVKGSGTYENNNTSSALRVGNNAGGTLNVEDNGTVSLGGQVTFCNNAACQWDGVINLKGGVMTAKNFAHGAGTGTGRINLDGGTLRALAETGSTPFIPAGANMAVSVGAGGAKFDTNGKSVLVAAPLSAALGVVGDLTVTGGGWATFSGVGDLAGAFTVGENTMLRWFDQDTTVSNYTVEALNLAAGSTLCIDATPTGCDTFNATATNITATAENPARLGLILRGDFSEFVNPIPVALRGNRTERQSKRITA